MILIQHFWRHFRVDSRAVTALEYALIAGLIGITLAGAASLFGGNLASSFNKIGTAVGAV